jgi:hypothetical protein
MRGSFDTWCRTGSSPPPRDGGCHAEARKEVPMEDFLLIDHGSIILLEARTDAASNWVTSNLSDDVRFYGRRFVMDRRCMLPLVQDVIHDGLILDLA